MQTGFAPQAITTIALYDNKKTPFNQTAFSQICLKDVSIMYSS